MFQRTPIWIAPRFDFPFTPDQHELFEREPATAQKLRDEAFDAYDSASFDVDHLYQLLSTSQREGLHPIAL